MNGHVFVADANLVIKLLVKESDTDQAKAFFADCNTRPARVFVPDHFIYEVINVAHRLGVDAGKAFDLFDAMRGNFLTVVSPTRSLWKQAQAIAQDGHPKSGYASIYDSIYHALAIDLKGLFITADKRHKAKAAQYGRLMLLSEWAAQASRSLSYGRE